VPGTASLSYETRRSLTSDFIEAEDVEHKTGKYFSFFGAFFLGVVFLTALPFLGAEVCAGGLVRPDFLICCVGNITAVFCGDCIERWVALEREDCVFAIFFVTGTEEKKNTTQK